MNAAAASWGDQGDGTYRNPILDADYPDVDIERLGDTYYMITSTMHYAPGMTLLESRDLVSWTLIGHVFDTLDWEPGYNWDRMGLYGNGVWAGDLARNDGTWYCYFIDTASGLYVSSASDIRGPWSRPECLLARTHWTDPAVFWDDEERQAYLVWNAANTLSQRHMGRGCGVATARLDLAGMVPGQQAGLCHHSGRYVLIGVRVSDDGSRWLVFDNDGAEQPGPRVESDTILLRTAIDGDRARFSWSLGGNEWATLGPSFRLTFGQWRGDRIGFCCWNEKNDGGHVDIDWFRYEHDGPRSSLA